MLRRGVQRREQRDGPLVVRGKKNLEGRRSARLVAEDARADRSFCKARGGADALAVADAVVVDLNDGVPENLPGATLAVSLTRETIYGNFVTLDLGGSRFATYAHLQPGSLRVTRGERVTRGQILGLVGNSGNADAPHLHFQVTDRNSILESEGLPYAIDSFEVLGKSGTYERREHQLPVDGEIIRFP